MKRPILPGCSALAVLASACGSGVAAVNPFAYVTNNDLSSISVFRIDPGSGGLTSVQTVATPGGGATYGEVHPSGRFFFVSGQFSNVVSSYSIDAAGKLNLVDGGTLATGTNPHNLALDPEGRFLYVANTSSDTVSGFTVDASGRLAAIAGSPFPTGHVPYDVKVAASGRFVYVTNRDSDDISVLAIGAGTGALTPIANQPFHVACRTAPCGPRAIEFSPSGSRTFVANRFSGDVAVFDVDRASGALTAIQGSPFAAGSDPRSLAVDPSGRYLYVPNVGSNDVSAYAIDEQTGVLTRLTGSPYTAGTAPLSIEVDVSGRYAFVSNSGSNSVSVFRIERNTGRLASVATAPTAGSAFSVALGGAGGS